MGKIHIQIIIAFLLITSSTAMMINTNTMENTLEDQVVETASYSTDMSDASSNIQDIYNNDIEDNTTKLVDTQPLTEKIETSSILDEVHSEGRDSYIVDFGFQQNFMFEKGVTVIDSHDFFFGKKYLRVDATAKFGIRLTLPVNITLTYSNTVEAGKQTQVTANMYDSRIPAGFFLDYGITIGGEVDFRGINLTPFELFNYTNSYPIQEINLPIDPTGLRTFEIPLPLDLIPGVGNILARFFGISLAITPTIDANILADLFYDNIDGKINQQAIKFNTFEKETFSLHTDEFSESRNDIDFGLTNFDMNFDLGINWGLKIGFAGLLKFLGSKTLHLLTYPTVPLFGIATDGVASGNHDLVASSELPAFDISSYTLIDSNGIVEPGDTSSLNVDFFNYGYGGATTASIISASNNVSISDSPSDHTFIHPEDTISHSLSFTMDSSYTGRNMTFGFQISWTSPDGNTGISTLSLTIRVLQSGDGYINIDDYTMVEPNDSVWDTSETVTFDIDMSSVGSAAITDAKIEILATEYSGYSSGSKIDELIGQTSINTWNSTILELTSPSSFTYNRVDVYVGLSYQLDSGLIYNDLWILEFDINPPAPDIELVDVYGDISVGSDNGLFEAGESFDLSAEITNIGSASSGTVAAGFYSNSTAIEFSNDILVFPDTAVDSNSYSSNTIPMDISLFTANQTVLVSLLIVYETPAGDIDYKVYHFLLDVVALPPPEINLNYYETYVYDGSEFVAGLPEPDSIVGITVNLDNIGSLGLGGIAKLTSNNSAVEMINSTSYYGNLLPGQNSNGDGFILAIPANFEGGTVRFTINMTIYSASGEAYSQLGYFDITIDAGDTLAPSLSISHPTTADAATSTTFKVDTQDDVGIHSVYAIYLDNSINEYNIIRLNESDGNYNFDLIAPNSGNLTVYIVSYDVSGNYQLSEELVIDINQQEMSDDPSSDTAKQSETTPTDSSLPDNEIPEQDSDAQIASLTWIIFISALGLTYVIRSRKIRY